VFSSSFCFSFFVPVLSRCLFHSSTPTGLDSPPPPFFFFAERSNWSLCLFYSLPTLYPRGSRWRRMTFPPLPLKSPLSFFPTFVSPHQPHNQPSSCPPPSSNFEPGTNFFRILSSYGPFFPGPNTPYFPQLYFISFHCSIQHHHITPHTHNMD